MKIHLIIRQFLAEFYGTFILVFIGTGVITVGLSDQPLIVAFAFASGAAIAIFNIGHISGAHLNPVVSLALFLDQRLSIKQLGVYVSAQILGAFFASLSLLMAQAFPFYSGLGPNQFDVNVSPLVIIILEMFLTFILVYVILAISERKELKSSIGLIVFITLLGIILVGGPLTSASLNPARSIAPALLTGGDALVQLGVYILGPILGAVLAAWFYRYLRYDDTVQSKIKG
jgi:aquaporin Z